MGVEDLLDGRQKSGKSETTLMIDVRGWDQYVECHVKGSFAMDQGVLAKYAQCL